MKHTDTHCHCGAHRRGSDHCPVCGCEEFETVCEHVTTCPPCQAGTSDHTWGDCVTNVTQQRWDRR